MLAVSNNAVSDLAPDVSFPGLVRVEVSDEILYRLSSMLGQYRMLEINEVLLVVDRTVIHKPPYGMMYRYTVVDQQGKSWLYNSQLTIFQLSTYEDPQNNVFAVLC